MPAVQRVEWRGLDWCRKSVKRLLRGKSDGDLDEAVGATNGNKETDRFEIH